MTSIPQFAQIVNIPDANFKTLLLSANIAGTGVLRAYDSAENAIVIDANNDGEIQVIEAQAVWKLNIGVNPVTNQITSLEGLDAFTNLRELRFYANNLLSLDLSALINLELLQCSSATSLQSIEFNSNPNLKYINLNSINISHLDLSGLPNLERLGCNSNITSLDVSGDSSITSLVIFSTNLSAITGIQDLIALDGMDLFNTVMPSLDLSLNQQLREVNLEGNSQMTSIIMGDQTNLTALHCNNNANLAQVVVGYAPQLIAFSCMNTGVTSLDLSLCPALTVVGLGSNPLQYLNLKNGSSLDNFFDEYLNVLPNPIILCVDEGEEAFFANYYNGLGQQVVLTTYCSFTPGGNYNTITGTSGFNVDGTGCSTNLPGVRYGINNGMQSGSVIGNQSGSYSFYPQTGTFTITPQLENSGWFTVTPPSASVSFMNNNNSIATQNFCISPNGSHPDLEIIVSPVIDARPGFDAEYRITYRNKGNQILSGDVSFTYDDAVMDFVTATVAPAVTAPGSMSWSYASLLPLETRSVIVTLNMNGPMENPPLINGNNISFSASITPAVGDEMPADNAFILAQTLVGSYDPNDITCLEGDTEHPDRIGEYLHYNVNFENTGTAPATFIVVKDIIDVAKFDVSSLQLIEASHNVATRINGNKVEFYFDAINLGPNEKGNVVFKIKTLPTLAVNSSVTQNANIYFDYNWPIVTNNATTTFQLLSAGNFDLDATVKLFPNPAATQVSITAQSLITSIQLFDVQGRLLEAFSPKMQEATLDVSGRTKGIYFVKVMTGSGVKVEKLVKE
jgi:hypothetical protein